MEQNSRNFEETEIDLIEYAKVLLKRKKVFIAVFLLVLAVGFVRIQVSPKIYKTTMILQPPVIGASLANKIYPETLENIRFLLFQGAFNAEVVKKLNVDPAVAQLNFEALIPPNTNFLMISISQKAKNKELGAKILRTLFDILFEKYSVPTQLENNRIDSEVKITLNNIASMEENINSLEERLQEIRQREEGLLNEIKSANAYTEDLTHKRDRLLKDNLKSNEVDNVFYLNGMQFNFSYINQLNNQLADTKARAIDRQLEIKNYKIMINKSQIELDKLKTEKQFSSSLKILKEPETSLSPASPSRNKSLALSIVMGLFFGVFAAFSQEFWANNLKKHD